MQDLPSIVNAAKFNLS